MLQIAHAARLEMDQLNLNDCRPLPVSPHSLKTDMGSGMQRLKQLPDVPTLDESGVKGYQFYGWFALWFPAATPAAYVNRIQSAVASAVSDPEVKQRFDEIGLESVGSTPQEFAKFFADDRAFCKALTEKIGVVPQ